MNKDERITYEEFMIMFRNAPRVAYMLYDKAEDEIDKYKNVIDKIKEIIKEKVGTEIHDMMYVIDISDILELLEEVE